MFSRAHNLCSRYPDYMVTFVGIGDPPVPDEQMATLGHCSQCAIFVRRDFWRRTMLTDAMPDVCTPLVTAGAADNQPLDQASAYQLISSFVIPVHRDERTREQRIMDDVRQQINRLSSMHQEQYYCYERSVLAIPLRTAFECIWRERNFDVDELRYNRKTANY